MVTTRGESNPSNTVRYKEELAFDEVHDLVYRAVLHPSLGQLAVWLNGRRIVDVAGQSIGAGTAECYWHVGVYFSGGITCPVAAEYANHLYPAPRDLTDRIDNRPAWPDD